MLAKWEFNSVITFKNLTTKLCRRRLYITNKFAYLLHKSEVNGKDIFRRF